MPFLQNAWYVAAWTDELGTGSLMHRKLLNQDILFYRRADGSPVAMTARCPHRFAPLHYGSLVEGERVRCRYHGLEFGPDGRCVKNPNSDGPPPQIGTRTFPLVEHHQLIWIWMGNPDLANPAEAGQEYDYLGQPDRYAVCKGYLHLACNFGLALDNLMDAAHVNFLHDSTLGSEALTLAKTVLREEDGVIFAERFAPDGAPSALFGQLRGNCEEHVDHWADGRWQAPCRISLKVGVTAVGAPRSEGMEIRATHLLTPETETTTHYFWALARDFQLDNSMLTEQLGATTQAIFTNEDQWMLEGQQQMLNGESFWDAKPKFLAGDVATAAVRRRLDRLIRAEQG
ncbi:MAG TPA: aromatic ring-hydroxylating dioxygenase subunit alpha [Steroidobacter sp.]|uniref:aromatic ring-hydroxylating dioxygenase subunit alpha n=1 Tax=Steroidobacter sp. TaxID=1978227 RepID=UPI002ED84EAD